MPIAIADRPPIRAHPTPAVIDIEASGFGRGSYPIEIGYVLPDGRSDCMLIRPADDWQHWDPSAERLHRITRSTLLRHGRPIAEVAARLNKGLAGLTVYSDGWGNDYTWLGKLYDATDRTPSFRLESLVTLLDEDTLSRWDVTKQLVFGEAHRARHRASADARLLQTTVVRLREAIS